MDSTTKVNDTLKGMEQITPVANVNNEDEMKKKKKKEKKKEEKKEKVASKCIIVLCVFTIIDILFSTAMIAGGFNGIFNLILHKKLLIEEGTEVNDIWVETPVPLLLRIYLFNLTNPDEFLNGAYPIVEELGPYVYREYHHKENVAYNSNGTVSYFQKRWWIWDEELSEGNLEDNITTLNTIPVSAAHSVEGSKFLMQGLNSFMNNVGEEAIVQATATQIIFDGYEDPILDFMTNVIGRDESVLDGINLESLIPEGLLDYDKFGWFYKRNNSIYYDGVFNMNSGQTGVQDFGMINWWNYTQNTSYFDYPCNMVTGSAGEMWPPNQKKDYIEFYSSDLCMTMRLYYLKEIKDSYGIPGYRYWGSKKTFANKTYLPEHECLCINDVCGPTGLLNAETCRMGAPAFISFPHFLNADPDLLKYVQGLYPDHIKHAFFIDLNPDLGIPLNVAARMQINMQVKPYPGVVGGITILKKVPNVILPMLWFEVLSRMSPSLAAEIKPVAFLASSYVPNAVFGMLLCLGIIVAVGLSSYLYSNYRKIQKKKSLIEQKQI